MTKPAASIVLALFTAQGMAAVSAEEAKQLGGPVLTEFGAERAGNKEGTIPAFKMERIQPPSGYDPKEPGRLPDPFNDKPLFSITAQNVGQYADKLSEGQKTMLAKYPGYRFDVYPSRRTTFFPKYILDNSLKNATSCKAEQGELLLAGCYGGIPFPIPKTGTQVVWNHLTKYVGQAAWLRAHALFITPDGKSVLQSDTKYKIEFPLYHPQYTDPAPPERTYYRNRFDQLGPARKVGEKYIFAYAMDAVNIGGRVYSYLPGQRRVKLAPDLSYDTPSPQSGGSSTVDENAGFNGPPDRYDFKLMGKKEMYILYNNYNMTDYKKCPNDKVATKGFLNPDCARWELHRTWVVEATLKPGFRHIYHKRVMHFDEDNWAAGNMDNYDASGKIYRADFVPHLQIYSKGDGVADNFTSPTFTADLQTGAWSGPVFVGFPGGGIVAAPIHPDSYFSPEALGGQGIR